MPDNKDKKSSGNPLLDQISQMGQGSAFGPALIPELTPSKGVFVQPKGQYHTQIIPEDNPVIDAAHESGKQLAAGRRFAAEQHNAISTLKALREPIEAKAWEEARKANPGLPDERIAGWQKIRADYLTEQLQEQGKKEAERQTSLGAKFPQAKFKALIGGDEWMSGAVQQGYSKAIVGDNSAMTDTHFKSLIGDNAGMTDAVLGGRHKQGDAVNPLTAKKRIDMSFMQDESGNYKPEYISSVMNMAGGDPGKFREAHEALLTQKADEFDHAKSIAANIVNSTLDYLHKVDHSAGMIPGTLGASMVGSKLGYYVASGSVSGLQAAAKAGTFLGNVLKSDVGYLTGNTELVNRTQNQYAGAVQAINQFSDRASTEAHPELSNATKDPLAFLDAIAGEATRLTAQIIGLGSLSGSGTAASSMLGKVGARAAAGRGSSLANTAANRVYLGIAKTVNAIDATRLPVYLDNVVSTGRMFFPSMYHDYYTDALAKGYTPEQAESKATQRASVAVLAMSLANWAGPRAKDVANKLPKQILQGVDKDVASSFMGKLGKFSQAAVQQFNVKGAALGGIGMGTSAFADAYQDHLEKIEKGEIDPETPFNPGEALKHSGEAAVIGFLSMGMSHMINGHGKSAETPQANAIYSAIADRGAFNAAVNRQISKGNITPEQAASLTGLVDRVAPEVAKYGADIKSGKMKPEMAVKLGIEQARMQETAEAVRALSSRTHVVKTIDAEGKTQEKIYGLDPETNTYTEAYGQVLSAQLNSLNLKASESQRAISQLKEGSYIRGRVIGGDEMLRITSKSTPEGKLTTEQANRILSEGPYTHERVDLTPYAEHPAVKDYMERMKKGELAFNPQHANDPILAGDGSIIDGHKRIAHALLNGETSINATRPRTTQEAAKSVQEERESTLGTDAPDLTGPNSEAVLAAREAYDTGLSREVTEADTQAGLITETARALRDAAEAVKDLPKEEAIDAIQKAAGHTVSPADAEHFLNVAKGKATESVFGEVTAGQKVASFETAQGSVYTVLPDGRTQRFKTAAKEQNEPQDLMVFVKFKDPEQMQDFLAGVQESDRTNTKVYLIDKIGNKYDTNAEAAGKDVRLALIDTKANKVIETVETSLEPKLGYHTFDQRRFNKNGNDYREAHLGNKVTKINLSELTPEVKIAEATPQEQESALGKLYESIPVITESPLWDKENNRPKEGVTAEDLREYNITEEVPEHLRHLEEEARVEVEAVLPKIDISITKGGKFEGDFLNDYEFLATGSEHIVYRSKDGSHVIKIGEPYSHPDTFDARVADFEAINKIVGDGSGELIGFYESKNGTKNPVYKQDFLAGESVPESAVREYLLANGFREVGGKLLKDYDGKTYEIYDLSDNFKMLPDGRMVAVDAGVYARDLAAEPTKTTVDYTTKSGTRVFRNEQGVLEVVNKNGEPVSDNTRRKALLEAAQNHDFATGEKATFPAESETWNDREIETHVAETSNNPAELATLWLHSERESQMLSGVEEAIIRNGITTTTESFDNFGDRNWRTVGMAKSYLRDGKDKTIRDAEGNIVKFGKKERGAGIDEIAREISDHEGIEVTPQDIVDFMVRFPNGTPQAERTFLSEAADKAAKRFAEITGFELNEHTPTTKKIAELAHLQAVERLSARERELYEQFLENEYTTREQEQRDYDQAIAEGRIDPVGEIGDVHAQPNARTGAEEAPQSKPAGEGRIDAEVRADEQPVAGSEQAETLIQKSGAVDYHVTGADINKAGWSKTGIQAFASQLKTGSRVAIHSNEQTARLNNGATPEAWTENGVLHINIEHPSLRPSALLEESAHLWIEVMRKVGVEIHDKGIELARDTPLYKYMEALHKGKEAKPDGLTAAEAKEAEAYVQAYATHSDPLYSFANEVLAKGIRSEGKDFAKEPDARKNFGKWLQSFWTAVKSHTGFKNLTAREFSTLTFKEFSRKAAEEIGSGKTLTTRIKAEKNNVEELRKRAAEQERDQDNVIAEERLDAVNSKSASSNPLGSESLVFEAGGKEKPLTDDPVINGIGKGGGSEIVEVIKTKNPELFKELRKLGDESSLADIFENPLAAPKEVQDLLGMAYHKPRGGAEQMNDGLMNRALTTLSEVMGEGHTAKDIVDGLAKYHTAKVLQEAAHQAAVKKGTKNQKAGEEKKMPENETGFIDALAAKIKDGTVHQRDIDALAKEYGISEGKVSKLVEAATDKLIGGEKMLSLSPDFSPKDEREDFIRLLTETADKDIATFHSEALQLIRAAYKNGIIDKVTAHDLSIGIEQSAGKEEKIYEFINEAKETLLPKEEKLDEPNIKPSVTSIKNEQTDMERAEMGLEPAMESAKYDFGSVWDTAMKTMDRNPDASANLVNELRQKIRATTKEENALILHRQVTFRTERRRLVSEINTAEQTGDTVAKGLLESRLSEVARELQDIYDIDKATGSLLSEGLNTRRMMAREDYSLEAMMHRERAENGGKPLSKEAQAELESISKRLEEAEQKIADFEKKKAEDTVGQAIEVVKKTADKPKSTGKPGVPNVARRQSLVERLKALHGTGSKMNDGKAMFSLAPESRKNPLTADDRPIIVDIVRSFLDDGHTDVNEIMRMTHETILEAVPEVTLRDVGEAFSEYGKVKLPNKDEIERELARLRGEERLVLSLEDATNSIPPLKSGQQRPKPTDLMRELQRKVKAMMDEKGIESGDPEKRLATTLDAIKNRLRNQIADLNKQILTREKAPKKKGVAYDTEALALRTQRDKLRSEVEALEGKREMSDEQRIKLATAAAERSIKEYERRIMEGDLSPQKDGSKTPETPELIALRAERDKLKSDYEKLKDLANPKRSPEEIALERLKKNIRKRMDELNERMRTGNFDKTVRKTVDLDNDALQLTREKEKIIFEYERRAEKARLAKMKWGEKAKDLALQIWNLPKGLLSTGELSAPFRQGAMLGAGNPKEWVGAFGEMLQQAYRAERHEMWLHALHESDIYPLIRQSKLYIAETGAKLMAREEQFVSKIPEKIPGYNVIYKAAERGYSGFLNKLRVDVFAKGVDLLRDQGITPETNPKAFADLASFINNATGRGDLGSLERAAGVLNGLMFSPRYLASRVNLLRPDTYYRMDPAVRIIAARNMLSYVAFGMSVLTLAALAGADVELDPRSSDFGKIKIGDTRYDIWAGNQPIIRYTAQFITAQRKSTKTGEIIEMDGTGYGGENRGTVAEKFGRTKASPMLGTGINWMTGKDMIGNEFSWKDEAMKNAFPLYWQDMYKIVTDETEGGGLSGLAQSSVPAFFGVGVQRYGPKATTPRPQ